MINKLFYVLLFSLFCTVAWPQQPSITLVDRGVYQRGCTSGQQPCEAASLPAHAVTVSSFAIGTYEVTQAEYLSVMGNNPAQNIGCNSCPVERVSWYGAVVFCNTLSQQQGLEPAYYSDPGLSVPFFSTAGAVYWDTEADGYRLPTEAEWEYAARGASMDNDFRYAGSNNWQEVAVTGSATQPAGSKPPNELGLYDMSGNVAEWVWDGYGDYPNFPLCDPRGTAAAAARVIRGGHFQQASGIAVSSRGQEEAGSQSSNIGFRVARTTGRMVRVAGGTFTMGCTDEQEPDCQNDEYPPHTVTVGDFFLSRFEVTQAEWAALVPEYTPLYNRGTGPDYPTYRVSWYDAATFCNRLSLAEGRTPAYYFDEDFTLAFDSLVGDQLAYVDLYWDTTADGYRLPTEAEWEYAARGGAAGGGTLYAGSNDLDAIAWHSGNSSVSSQPVGALAPNALGLYDMTGNVYEWCWDWYDSDYYEVSPSEDPLGPPASTVRTIRGGSWNTTPDGSRLANRLNFLPGARRTTFAFRVARSK
ncbi:MAG: SUMF1/EgtB/PvdO family nonheme iron enzyme [Phaeodactylibacter sp.]|uniref:formylglycine-generating enzyme family protein n=1 Tax=Phaeodactylibacter sp. TaxID=1940289 RepID=UPI0032EFA892